MQRISFRTGRRLATRAALIMFSAVVVAAAGLPANAAYAGQEAIWR